MATEKSELPLLADLTPAFAHCCVISSCYTDFPDCLGLSGKFVVTCFDCQYRICKVGQAPIICVAADTEINIIQPTTCLGGTNQCCCFDNRCAFPCNEDVPCMLTWCFLTCFVDYKFRLGFYKTISKLRS